MASEVALMPSVLANEQALNFSPDILALQIPRGADVRGQFTAEVSNYSSKPSPFQCDYSSSGFTPPSVWSELSPSPVLESSACSTETDSNDEDDFMAGLAEQMTHFMLGNEENEEEEVASVSMEKPSMCSSNWMPCVPKPVALNSEEQNYLQSAAWHDRVCHSANRCHLHPPFLISFPDAKENPLDQLRYAVGTKVRCSSSNSLRHRGSCHPEKEQVNDQAVVSRKIEEFLWKQALKQAPQMDKRLSKDISSVRSDFSSGSYVPGTSKPRNLHGARFQRPWKLRDVERRNFNNQSRGLSQGPFSSWSHNGRPQQPTSSSLHGRLNFQSRSNDQRSMRMSDSSSSIWCANSNLNGNSNMRALFLRGNTNGRESAGTGVFLPRCAGISHDSKRKPACSSVLLPSRIVEALNLQMEDIPSPQYFPPPYMNPPSGSPMASSTAPGLGSFEVYHHQDYCSKSYSSSHSHTQSQGGYKLSEEEFNLPIDWTY